MKRFVCFALVCIILALGVGAAAEPETVSDHGYGPVEDVLGRVAVYCNEWDKIIGPSFGSDLSFNQKNISNTSNDFGILSAEIDGITTYMDEDMNVLMMEVIISDSSRDSLWTLARCLAIINAVYYDLPTTQDEMKHRFLDLMDVYMDGLDNFALVAKHFDKDERISMPKYFYLDQHSYNDTPVAYYCLIGGTWFFSLMDHGK